VPSSETGDGALGAAATAAARWWDTERHAEPRDAQWLSLARVRERMNRAISGDEAKDWIEHTLERHVRGGLPVPRCVSLACGGGKIERRLAGLGAFSRCVGLDVSEGQLERARRAAEEAGIVGLEYRLADLDEDEELPEAELIVAHMSLHHVTRLESLAERVARALTPDGCFAALEYVGPDRFDFPPRQIALFEHALHLLPERYRESVAWAKRGSLGDGRARGASEWARVLLGKLRSGSFGAAIRRRLKMRRVAAEGSAFVKQEIPTTRGAELAAVEPSEAARSSAILAAFSEHLEMIEVRPFGSALLMLVLDDIAGNFADDDPLAQALLEMLFAVDDALTAAGSLSEDFVYFAARRRE